ncbi:PREDICTED: prostatic acid phosphatase-like [Amphimedon queenslandica]|uniref:Acid phosphatase n=1 Tax=Amphimedon queenslandica TaxID=400682 RepID=A0A1X7UF94_AMPQE|nr:PREDICTED: prostatic acid phosphatase-like [Amphimedon queenslandica]|eukprot:XP_019854771.1 PREDICTED: prostatic acid phosphatase-like [Amphimedon queenslandica]
MVLELFLLLSVLLLPPVRGDKLEFVSIVFRHGARSPTGPYKNDIYKEYDWPQGYGQLSIEGMKEEYNLGKLFQSRYLESGFMNATYNRTQIYVRSTQYDRTIMSAQCVLAAMYPPTEEEEFQPGLDWQPIPVHSTIGPDYLLRGFASKLCPRYELLKNQTEKSSGYLATWNDNKELFVELSNYTGEPVNLTNIWHIQDTLFQQWYANYTTPYWYTTELMDKLQELANYVLSLLFDSTMKKQLTGGLWANEVIENMEDKSSKESNLTQRMILYSAHDTTVAAMLSVFNLFDKKQPLFSAAFVIELYSNDDNGHYVKFLYHNETKSDQFHELTHPNCETNCPLGKLKQIMKPYLVSNISQIEELCSLDEPTQPTSGNKATVIGLGVALGVALVLLITTLAILIIFCIRVKRNNEYQMLQDSTSSNDKL